MNSDKRISEEVHNQTKSHLDYMEVIIDSNHNFVAIDYSYELKYYYVILSDYTQFTENSHFVDGKLRSVLDIAYCFKHRIERHLLSRTKPVSLFSRLKKVLRLK